MSGPVERIDRKLVMLANPGAAVEPGCRCGGGECQRCDLWRRSDALNGRENVTRAAVWALTVAAASEHSFPEWLAGVLGQAAARLGGSAELTAGRPGSWEADLVRRLVSGTVGEDDEYLPAVTP